MNAENTQIQVVEAPWAKWQSTLKQIRTKVFIEEQKVPVQDEWDEHDAEATHFIALTTSNATPVGTARLLNTGKITRMAVLKKHRGSGVGSALLGAAIAKARKRQLKQVFLDSQLDAKGFYTFHHFKAVGKIFMDAGIRHIHMVLNI